MSPIKKDASSGDRTRTPNKRVGTCLRCVLFILGRTGASELKVLTWVCNSLIYSLSRPWILTNRYHKFYPSNPYLTSSSSDSSSLGEHIILFYSIFINNSTKAQGINFEGWVIILFVYPAMIPPKLSQIIPQMRRVWRKKEKKREENDPQCVRQ